MGRTSSNRGPREDDQRKREESALLQGNPDEGRGEPRRGEAPGPGEASAGLRDEVARPQGTAPSQHSIDDRAALAASFPPSSFPARRDRLVEEAEALFADESLVTALKQLPDDTYGSVGELWVALGGEASEEERRR